MVYLLGGKEDDNVEKIIIIKYGELTTKKDNINYFLSTLKNNIKHALSNLSANITYDKGRMFIKSDDDKYDAIINELKHVFGIHEIILGYEFNSNDLENIKTNIIKLTSKISNKSFKVETKRSDKTYPYKSMEVSKILGAVILKNCQNMVVDVKSPDIMINVEIRHNKSYIYFDKIKGLGGYPVSSLGKGMLMLSGGIDSVVAGYLALKRGVKIEAIYFESPPHTSIDARNKVISLAQKLACYTDFINLHIINFTPIQEAILNTCNYEYLITLMRRMMYRISERICLSRNGKIIINGESIGQVASQTLTSMQVINEVVNIPVIRPLACLDKLDIIKMAKQIDTYDISILPYEDCCTIFVPKHPVINPNLNVALDNENLFDYESLIEEAIKTKKTIKITKKDTSFDDIL